MVKKITSAIKWPTCEMVDFLKNHEPCRAQETVQMLKPAGPGCARGEMVKPPRALKCKAGRQANSKSTNLHVQIGGSMDLRIYRSCYKSSNISIYRHIAPGHLSLYESINLPINQSVNLSIYHSTNLPIYRSISRSM